MVLKTLLVAYFTFSTQWANNPKKKFAGLSFIDKKEIHKRTVTLLARVGLSLNPKQVVGELTIAQQQLIEIAKAMANTPKLIIFDEPTTSLSKFESQNLFHLIKQLQTEDIAMIYISHNLEDVKLLTDRIVVLRDGEFIAQRGSKDYSMGEIVRDMVGRDMDEFFPSRNTKPDSENILELKDFGLMGKSQMSFSVKEGEVLGFYGLVGAGRSEMARRLYGLDLYDSGSIWWMGERIKSPNPPDWIKKGVAFLTENRQQEGLLMNQSIQKNIQLSGLPKYKNWTQAINVKSLSNDAATQARFTTIKYNANELDKQKVATLSGGNQQKVVLSKWLLTKPKLFILDEPTKGIDIGAKYELYRIINSLVEEGTSILLISSEIEELMGLSDRILTVKKGGISGEFMKNKFDRATILEAALH